MAMRILRVVLVAVLTGCGLLSIYVFVWFRDRYSGGPMHYTRRWILHTPCDASSTPFDRCWTCLAPGRA